MALTPPAARASPHRSRGFACACAAALACAPAHSAERWCDALPRPANASLQPALENESWYDVRHVSDGVFALIEPKQFQEVISWLVVGRGRALLFDSGLGLVPIRPVVERLTSLPVTVVNSHTHYDHVGGNAEFAEVLALDTPYTRANQAGFDHAELAGEAAAQSFCGAPPPGADTAGFHTRPWRAAGAVADGHRIDLGGRELEVLHVPGHTPDAIALLDRAAGLLFTGDTYYEGPIWLFVPETGLDRYEASLARLADLSGSIRMLLPAHNVAVADPARLGQALTAFRRMRRGEVTGVDLGDRRRQFRFQGFSFLVAEPLLAGARGDTTRGGSGLTAWP